ASTTSSGVSGTCAPSSEGEHAAGEVAVVHVLDGATDVAERVRPGDQLVELEAPGQVQLDEQRDVLVRAAGAVAAPHDRLVVVHAADQEAGLGAELGHAEDDGGAAPVEQVD